MKSILATFLSITLLSAPMSEAQNRPTRAKVRSSSPTTKSSTTAVGSQAKTNLSDLKGAMNLAKKGQYEAAAIQFFQLSVSPRYAQQRMQIRYLLGLMLYQLKLYQLAAFQFISVIRDGNNKYISQSLEKLSLAANELGDDTLLNYAISRVKTESFPAVHKDMLFFRIGEYQLRNGQHVAAVRSFNEVPQTSALYEKSLYMKGLALSYAGELSAAIDTFNVLYELKREAPINDSTRVAALIGKARALYQNKSWDESIEAYRNVPRDTALWHDTIFESSWAMMRSGRFRSAISNFQSLHSPYYEESYIPESLLLRSIVYLYICQYDEMEKVLDLFNKIYKPVYKSVNTYLKTINKPTQYFNDVVKTLQAAEKESFDPASSKFAIPYLITQKVSSEGDFQRSFDYIKKLANEKKRSSALSPNWQKSGLGKYAKQTLERRIQKARAKGGRQIRAHMISVKAELIDLFEQEGFIRFEMINSKKELLKKKVAGKDLPKDSIDEETSRDYYIQNGYEYWPFRGEYWLDELGNYHYLGTQSCE